MTADRYAPSRWTCPCGAVLRSEKMGRTTAHAHGRRHQEWERAYLAGEVDRAQ